MVLGYLLCGVPPEIDITILIDKTFCVTAYKDKSKVGIHDLIDGFTHRMTKYSQVDSIVSRLEQMPLNGEAELDFAGRHILSLCDECDTWDDEKRLRVSFLGKQLQNLKFDNKGYMGSIMAAGVNPVI